MAQGRRGAAPSSASYRNRVAQQQAVLNQLRAGKPVIGAQAATPFLNIFGSTGGVRQSIPPLYAAELGGQEILINKGGWGQGAESQGAINVGGRTWDPMQKGQDLIYRPRGEAGQYGSVLPGEQVAPAAPQNTPPGKQPPAPSPTAKLSPEEQAYNQERSRIAQLTAQNPEFQNIGQLRNDLRDQGMAIWAAKYGGLAKNVKPGQSGYEAIQKTLYPGGAPLPAMSAESEAMLNAIAPVDAMGVRTNITPMPGQPPILGGPSEAMFQAVTNGGALVTPMPQASVSATPQAQAQELADNYKKALLLGNDPLGLAGIRQYGQ